MDKELLAKIEEYLKDNYIEPPHIDRQMSSRNEEMFDNGRQRRTSDESSENRRKIHL